MKTNKYARPGTNLSDYAESGLRGFTVVHNHQQWGIIALLDREFSDCRAESRIDIQALPGRIP
jgi:hypothetical protein